MAYDEQATMMAGGRPPARLIVRQGTQAGVTFPLTKEQVILGREEEVDIVIQDPEVSRRHAQINWQADTFVIRDLGSTNGVFVNSVELVAPHPLQPGDTIRMGQTTLLFQVSAASAPGTPVSSVGQPASYVTGAAVEPADQEISLPKNNNRRWLLIGCGCLVALCLCLALVTVIIVAQNPDFSNQFGNIISP